jgi:hypothetical protein
MMVRYSLTYGSHPMTAADFRRIALSLEGVEEYSHAGLPAFREEAGNLLRWPRKRGVRKSDA